MFKFVLYNQTFYYTEDNWKTYKISKKNPGSNYESETDGDIIVKFKLYKNFGSYQGEEIVKALLNIRELLNDKYILNGKDPIQKDGYGHSFEVLAIATMFKKSFKEVIEDNLIIGSDDGKVDAVVKSGDTYKCFQIKLFDKVSVNDFDVLKQNMKEYCRTKLITSSNSSDLLNYCQKKIKGNFNLDYYTISSEKRNRNNYNSLDIIKSFFKMRLCPMSDNYITLELPYMYNESEINFVQFEQSFFMYYPAKKLCELIEMKKFSDYQFDSLFSGNVRRFKNDNIEIISTLKDPEEREKFYLYNNGISLCGEIKRYNSGTFEIKNPMIINGQQTFKTIYNEFTRNRNNLNNVRIPLFLKQIPGNALDMRYKVAKYNNKQMSVKENDFLSIDENVRKLQFELYDYSLNKHLKDASLPEIFLDIISNGDDSAIKLSKSLFQKNSIISVSDLLRLILTINNPNKVNEFKNKKNFDYETTSKEAFKNVDVKKGYNCCLAIYKYNIKLNSFGKPKKELVEYTAANLVIQYLIYKGIAVNDAFNMAKTVKDNYNLDIVKLYKSNELYDYYDLGNLKMKC